jgi:hypothetical protein
MALSAQKLGYGLLFNASGERRWEIAQLLAQILLPMERWSDELRRMIDALPRRDQRQIQRVGTQYRESGGSGRTLAEEATVWIESVERLIVRLALLTTDDFVSVSRALVLRLGVLPSCCEEGGLLVFPEVQELCRFFISDDYVRQRTWLTAP